MSIDTIIRAAMDAGVELSCVDGQLLVTGKRRVLAVVKPQLRQYKAEIIAHLSAANAPEPSPDPTAWRELAEAYHMHHFACKTCIAAGQGRGLRCGCGAALWTTYQEAL